VWWGAYGVLRHVSSWAIGVSMALGSLQQIIVCVPVTTGATGAPCQTVGGVKYRPAMQSAYLVDPANSSFLDMALEPLDVVSASSAFLASFSMVVLVFLLGRGVGSVLSLIRKG
jgi:hypothetical protein